MRHGTRGVHGCMAEHRSAIGRSLFGYIRSRYALEIVPLERLSNPLVLNERLIMNENGLLLGLRRRLVEHRTFSPSPICLASPLCRSAQFDATIG